MELPAIGEVNEALPHHQTAPPAAIQRESNTMRATALRRSTNRDAQPTCCCTPPVHVTAEELTYNGQALDRFVPERTAAYISQVGAHAWWVGGWVGARMHGA